MITGSTLIAIIGCAVGVIGIILSIISYFNNVKKQSNSDTEKYAYFQGEMKAKMDELLRAVEKLDVKLSKNTEDLYNEISDKIAEHETRYHNARGN